ncbi:hypothetical protein EON65_28295 [archaeon]|nr:MAG: hypothetical protein EON65_28295 [archaeon]
MGNGHCSYTEYLTHFSLWAVLKAPLLIGRFYFLNVAVCMCMCDCCCGKQAQYTETHLYPI